MSVWSRRRKQAVQAKAPTLNPIQDLNQRVAYRICAIIYSGRCDCAARGRGQTCNNMLLAAQHAIQEILAK